MTGVVMMGMLQREGNKETIQMHSPTLVPFSYCHLFLAVHYFVVLSISHPRVQFCVAHFPLSFRVAAPGRSVHLVAAAAAAAASCVIMRSSSSGDEEVAVARSWQVAAAAAIERQQQPKNATRRETHRGTKSG